MCSSDLAAFKEWIENKENSDTTRAVSEKVMETLSGYKADSKEKQKLVDFINERKDYLIKKSIWALGGDGWAYDI